MTKALSQKMKSNCGASMMLALALFLVCVMVSSVILAASSSGASRNAKRIEQQKGYLAVSSASDLLMTELKQIGSYAGLNITGRYGCKDCNVNGYIEYNGNLVHGVRLDAEYTTNPVDKDYVSNPLDDGHLLIPIEHKPYVFATSDESQSTLDGMFGDLFQRACNQVFITGMDYEEKITIGLSEKDSRMPDVICRFVMDEEYKASFLLTTEISEYSVLISMHAQMQEIKLPDTVDETDVHTIYYKKFDPVSGTYTTVVDEWTIPIEVNTVQKRVSWNVPIIEKGGLS